MYSVEELTGNNLHSINSQLKFRGFYDNRTITKEYTKKNFGRTFI